MNYLFLLLLIVQCSYCSAQSPAETATERRGFLFGLAPGASLLAADLPNQPPIRGVFGSFPNFKFGYRLRPNIAIALCLPGTVYERTGMGRQRQRGFEGIVPSVQYWLNQRWWVLAGAGIALDAPAFYDIKDETERTFYFGTAVLFETGYELWQHRKFALDVHCRVHYNQLNFPQGRYKGVATSLLIGFNWQ